jgi:hypothetical protein
VFRNRVSGKISVRMHKLSQKPGFLVSGDLVSVTGRDRDVFRNRVSTANLGEDAQTLIETRFLSLTRSGIRNRARSRCAPKPGFSCPSW